MNKIILLIKIILLKILNRNLRIQSDLLTYLNSSHDQIIKKYNQADSYKYPEPKSLEGKTQFFLPSQKQVGVFERYLAIFHHAKLHTQEGYIQLANNKFIVETAWSDRNLNDPYFSKLFKCPEQYKSGKWFSSLLFWSSGYYHWICDVLPRFYLVLNDLPADTRIIIHANAKPWQIRSLEALGIDQKRLIRFPENNIWELEELYFAPPAAMTGDHMHEAVEWTYKTIIQNLKIKSDSNRRIYISRGQAGRRRIINESELIDFLKQYDFEIIINENLSFDQQVELFYSSTHIIAPHGAGLSNILFSKSGASVLEIFEKSTMRRCYWTLANAKNIQYTCYIGNTIDIGMPGEADIEIDMSVFKLHFENWLKKS